MQTFLPYMNFSNSARVLDSKRLCKQQTEALQIYNTITGKSEGWKNHPAVLQWKNYSDALLAYIFAVAYECNDRGYKIQVKTLTLKSEFNSDYQFPNWFGCEKFHSSHRSKLLWKGRVDAVCERLKRYHKVRSINTWLISKGYSSKNILNREEVYDLEQMAERLSCREIPNYYSQFNWTENDDQEYVWPSNL